MTAYTASFTTDPLHPNDLVLTVRGEGCSQYYERDNREGWYRLGLRIADVMGYDVRAFQTGRRSSESTVMINAPYKKSGELGRAVTLEMMLSKAIKDRKKAFARRQYILASRYGVRTE